MTIGNNLAPPFRKKNKVKFHSKFRSILTTEKKFSLITGGRGGGKSYLISILALLCSYEKGYNIAVFRYTMSSAEDSIIPEVMEKLSILGLKDDFYPVGNKIHNKLSGSYITFKGIKTGSGNQTANLKGFSQYRMCIIEEAEEFNDYETFKKLSKSIRKAEKKGQTKIKICLVMNPALKSHWVYQNWIKDQNITQNILGYEVEISQSPLVNHIHSTFLDVPSGLSRDWIDEAKYTYKKKPDEFGRDYVGLWSYVNAGVIFQNWGEFNSIPKKQGLRRCLGIDLGTASEMAAVLVTIDEKEKKSYYELLIYEKELSFFEKLKYLSAIIKKLEYPPISIDTNYPDLTRELIKRTSADIKNAYKMKMIEGGISKMKGFEILIHSGPISENLKLELSLYRRDSSGKINKGQQDHAIDAARYALVRLIKEPNIGGFNGEGRKMQFFGAV